MIEVEGYKMFVGVMKIVPKTDKIKSFEVEGDWLYKPEYDCWYCKGCSYTKNLCTIIKDYIDTVKM